VCGKTFGKSKAKGEKHRRYFRLFTKWVMTGVSVEELIDIADIELSSKQLTRYFHKFLNYPVEFKRLDKPKEINLKCDAKHFGRYGCTMVFKEGVNIIFWFYAENENYFNYRYCFSRLQELGYIVKSTTSDKHGSLVSAVRTAYPDIPHQFCLVHLQRRCQTLLTQKPETEAGQDLLKLVHNINEIKTHGDKKIFLNWFNRIWKRHEQTINHRTYNKDKSVEKKWWYTHKNLRLAFYTIRNSLDNMFFYLDDKSIPKDTNGLEAEFTHLKTKLNMHRGLSRKRRENFVSWYWHLKSKGY